MTASTTSGGAGGVFFLLFLMTNLTPIQEVYTTPTASCPESIYAAPCPYTYPRHSFRVSAIAGT
jgi:hypothetical protein